MARPRRAKLDFGFVRIAAELISIYQLLTTAYRRRVSIANKIKFDLLHPISLALFVQVETFLHLLLVLVG